MAEATYTAQGYLSPTLGYVQVAVDGTSTYYCYINGAFLESNTSGYFRIPIPTSGQRPIVEVFDDSADEPTVIYSDVVTLQWDAAENAVAYDIEEWATDEWQFLTRLLARRDGPFSYTSRALPDDTAWQFRVVPIDAAGNRGTAREFEGHMIRLPDPLSFTVTKDTGFIISEAA